MKNLISILAVLLALTSTCILANTSSSYQFLLTGIVRYNLQNMPSININGNLSGDIRPSSDQNTFLYGVTDFSYTRPPTTTFHSIVIDITYQNQGGNNIEFCKATYNALTNTIQWNMRTPYQPNPKLPPITCNDKIYPGHLFIIVKQQTPTKN